MSTPSRTIGMMTTPRLLFIGGGSLGQLADAARRAGLRRPLIVTDAFMSSCGLAQKVTGLLAKGGIECAVFDGTTPDPSTEVVSAAASRLREEKCDSVIGLGGGSPLDAAKAIAVLATNGGSMRDYMGYHRVSNAGLPMLAIPTTAGTGSEVTKVTVITDSTNSEKMMCLDIAFLPTAAIVDYELTFDMPMRLTADTGIDSLTHAIEAYVSRKAHPHTDTLALSAMRLISGHIRTACCEPRNATAREAMMLAATQAGMAFSNSSVCLVHGMSRPMGAFFHVPHGLSNAMLLPAVTRFSVGSATGRYADCARAMGLSGNESDAVAADRLIAFLSQLNLDLKVPPPADYGIDRVRWEELKLLMARQALASGSPANNPRIPNEEEIARLYDEVYNAAT